MHETPEFFTAAESAGHVWERRKPSPEDEHVLGHTRNWLNALPKGVRPIHLPEEFPRIVNALSSLWDETAALDLYFQEKEFSPREHRQGFAPLIKEELLAMHVYSLRTRSSAPEARVPQKASLLGD